MKLITFVRRFNIKKESEDLGISFWQAPSFLFIMMGLFIIAVMMAVYFVSSFYDAPEVLIISECVVVIVIFSIGNVIIGSIEQIAKANKIKSEFVAIASHQLKTPLSQMNWELEILLSKHQSGLSAKQIEIIKIVSKSHETMTRLVNDLLDVARIDQGKLMLSKEKIDMLKIVENVVDNNKILANASNVEISIVNSSNSMDVLGDKKRIAVVVDNLVSNAVKYIDKKGFVEIKIENDKKNTIVSVKDNGVGIPENQQDKVFQKFFRSNNATRYQTEGTGLGLYISKNIIEQSGGKMRFKSIEGVGSEFYFSLPIYNEISRE
ncbi:MAG: HAMP domain-containing sensor histidine kinase [bacterium]|nr:HAMP domain-containing sensor histidine kinase [bacterium]